MQQRIIAVANHKGGVAKTTSVVSIGAALAEKRKRVLLIDLDAQANLTLSLNKGEVSRDLADAMQERKELPIVKLKKNLDLVPASVKLAGVEAFLAAAANREFILKELIEPIAANYDFILLDCPPALGFITVNALTAATEVIIPLTAEPLPVNGLKMLEDFIEAVRQKQNEALSLSGILITKWRGRALEKYIEETLRSKYGEKVFKTIVRENIAIAEASLSAEDIIEYDKESNGAKDYREVTKELLKR